MTSSEITLEAEVSAAIKKAQSALAIKVAAGILRDLHRTGGMQQVEDCLAGLTNELIISEPHVTQ